MTDIATLNVKVTSSGIELTNRELEKLGTTAAKTEANAGKLGKAASTVGNAFRGLSGLIAGLGLGAAANAIASATDRFASMQGQLKLVTSSQAELNEVYQRALGLANETGQSVEATVNLYARLARSTEELGLSQDRLFTITKAINQSFIVSGASAQEASAAILQLSQGLAAGALRGEELNSVMENSPRLARALADGLGVGIGQLRDMGKEGELTAERVTGALEKMAGSIDAEFQQMPMTIGRVMQQIKNDLLDTFGSVDTGPAIQSLQELKERLADPEMKRNLRDLGGLFVDLGASIASAGVDIVAMGAKPFTIMGNGIAALIDKARDLGIVRDRLDELGEQLVATDEIFIDSTSALKMYKDRLADADKLINDATDDLIKLTGAQGKSAKSTKEMEKTLKDMGKEMASIEKRHEAANKLMDEGHDALDAMVQKSEDYVEQLRFEVSLIGKTEREQALLTAERRAGAGATEDLKNEVRALTGELYDNEQAMKATEEAARKVEDANRQMQAAWAEGRDVLSGFFFELAADGKNAFDTLVDGFKAMIAKMVAEAAANQILLGIGTVAGGLGWSSVANAATAAGQGGGIPGIPSLSGSMFDWFRNNSSFFSHQTLQNAVAGDGGAAIQTEFDWVNAGWNLAGGFAGGLAANQVFGKTSGVGSAVGALAGSALIPIPGVGTAVGAFAGGALESLLGGKNNGDNKGRADVNLGTGESSVYGVGKSFEQANVDRVAQMADALVAFSASIGGSSAILNLSAGNNSGISVNGQSFGNNEAKAYESAIKAIIDGATKLDASLKTLVANFDGTTEETLIFSTAIINLAELIKNNPVEQAVSEFADAQAAAGATLAGTYADTVTHLSELIRTYDGSADATARLNGAMAENQQAAYALAVAIQSVSQQLETTLGASAQNFRETLMTEDEIRKSRQAERNELRAQLPHMTDPNEISQTAQEINRLNQLIFNSLSPEGQTNQAEAFARQTERVNEIAQRQLERSLEAARKTQDVINNQTQRMLQDAGQDFQRAADMFLQAVRLFTKSTAYNYGEV